MEKFLVLGSKGMLGQALLGVFGSEAVGWDREDADVTQINGLRLKIKEFNPTAVINCVAYNDVDGAEEKMEVAMKLNAEVPKHLALICEGLGITFVHFSTNYVFDGEKGEYVESDVPSPLSNYAKSKYEGESGVISSYEKSYLVRTAVLFGQKGQSELSKKSFIDIMLSLSEKQTEIKAVSDEVNSITYAVDLAWAVKVLLSQKFPFGIYHFANSGEASWYDLAKEIFEIRNLDIKLVPVASSEFPRKALRPKKSVLLNTKFIEFRPWQEAAKEFLSEKQS